MTALLTLKNLSLSLNGRMIFEQISFEILKGDFVTIIGPNGAGKSSLLKTIVGLQKPTFGTLNRAPQTRIGYMPQRLSLNEMMPLTVETFLKTSKDHSALSTIIKQTSIEKLLKLSMHTLSGGEYQRVLLSRALLQNPNLLILDEPAQGLDVSGQNQFFHLIDHLHKDQGVAILMVSHDLHFVHRASQKVICLNGHICCIGKPDHVKSSKEYKDLFPHYVGSEVLPYHHTHDHTHDDIEEMTCGESCTRSLNKEEECHD